MYTWPPSMCSFVPPYKFSVLISRAVFYFIKDIIVRVVRDGVNLTGKQEAFVLGLIEGKTQYQAYMDAGYSVENKARSTIDEAASRLMKNSKILARYNELKVEAKEKALWTREEAIDDLKWLKEQSKKTIEEYGEVKHAPATAFLGAITELNKLGVLYDLEVEKLRLNNEKTKKDLSNDQSTEDKLKDFFNTLSDVVSDE